MCASTKPTSTNNTVNGLWVISHYKIWNVWKNLKIKIENKNLQIKVIANLNFEMFENKNLQSKMISNLNFEMSENKNENLQIEIVLNLNFKVENLI